MKRTSIQDIAAAMDLSRNTVSKALTGSDIVAPETRKLVVKTALEMGYPRIKITIPEDMTEINVRQKAANILLLCNSIPSGFWSRIIMGISEIITQNHDNMLLRVVSKEEEEYNILPAEFSASNVDGVIFLSVFSREYQEVICKTGKPVVFLDAPVDYYETLKLGDIIMPEGFGPTKSITAQLIRQGLKRLCFIGDITYCKSINDRYSGFLSAHKDCGLKFDTSVHFTSHTGDKYYNLEEVMDAINKLDYIPDAIVCANDDIAKDVYQILKRSKLLIPDDIAISGFDNSEAAELLDPPLTTVAVHNKSMGNRLASQLYHRINDPESPHELISISSDVMFRASSVRYTT